MELRRESQRNENKTPAQIERRNWRQRQDNMPEEALQSKRAGQTICKEFFRDRRAEAERAARPTFSTYDILVELDDEEAENDMDCANKVIDELGPKCYLHGAVVLKEDLQKAVGAKYANDPEVVLYSHDALTKTGCVRAHLRNWRPTVQKPNRHHCVYATPLMNVALWHARKALDEGKTIDMHVIHPNDRSWGRFYQVLPFWSSRYFIKCADQVPSDAIYRGKRTGPNREYVWFRIWQGPQWSFQGPSCYAYGVSKQHQNQHRTCVRLAPHIVPRTWVTTTYNGEGWQSK